VLTITSLLKYIIPIFESIVIPFISFTKEKIPPFGLVVGINVFVVVP
jgi:hypothetical protein